MIYYLFVSLAKSTMTAFSWDTVKLNRGAFPLACWQNPYGISPTNNLPPCAVDVDYDRSPHAGVPPQKTSSPSSFSSCGSFASSSARQTFPFHPLFLLLSWIKSIRKGVTGGETLAHSFFFAAQRFFRLSSRDVLSIINELTKKGRGWLERKIRAESRCWSFGSNDRMGLAKRAFITEVQLPRGEEHIVTGYSPICLAYWAWFHSWNKRKEKINLAYNVLDHCQETSIIYRLNVSTWVSQNSISHNYKLHPANNI